MLMCYSMWFDENRRDAAGFYEYFNAFVLKKHSEPYSDGGFPAYFFDPDSKVCYEIPLSNTFDGEEPNIFTNFSSERWTFVDSGTVEVAGNEYYSETYHFNITYRRFISDRRDTVAEKDVTIAFDKNGTPVYLQDKEDANPVDDLTTLDQIFWEADTSGSGYAAILPLTSTAPHYGEYVDFSIGAETNIAQFDLKEYEKVDVTEFTDMVKKSISDDIDAELGLN